MSFSKEDLSNISIFRLREIGREYGVKSPTRLKKEQLVNAILDVVNGNAEPCFNATNRGRPALSNEKDKNFQKVLGVEKLRKIQELVSKCEKEILKIILE